MFLVTFFFTKPTRASEKKKQNVQRKKNTLAQCSRPPDRQITHPAHCVEHSNSFFFFIFFYFQTLIKLNSFQSPRYWSLTEYMTFLRGQRTFSTLFNRSTLRTHSSSRDRSLNVKLECVLDFKSNTHPGFIKARPHYSQQSPCLAISIGVMVAFGSPWPDLLAEDCRLIIARRHCAQSFDECAWMESIMLFE